MHTNSCFNFDEGSALLNPYLDVKKSESTHGRKMGRRELSCVILAKILGPCATAGLRLEKLSNICFTQIWAFQ